MDNASLHCDFLTALQKCDAECGLNSLQFAGESGVDHQNVVGLIKSLQSQDQIIEAAQISETQLELLPEGREICEHGSHEILVFNLVPASGSIAQSDLMKLHPYAKQGFSKAMSNGWLSIEKSAETANKPMVSRKTQEDPEDCVRAHLQRVMRGDATPTAGDDAQQQQESVLSAKLLQEYKRRKLITEVKLTSYNVKRGSNFESHYATSEQSEANESATSNIHTLTSDMLRNTADWSTLKFKQVNLRARGVLPEGGHLHPLIKLRSEVRRVLRDMGFSEMPTNNYVESSFWNFDSLFQPQAHPARDAQDTFFLERPASASHLPPTYLKRVRQVHEAGAYGSQGHQSAWSPAEAHKNVLRTHTTAVTTRMLYRLASQAERERSGMPVQYFSIDRVFRNETLDATHLAEFHQVEGVVVDRGLTLGHMKTLLHAFFRRLMGGGATQQPLRLRFKPAYNPYTEPSMEIFAFNEQLDKWVEIGNSGVFRPEVLLPLGLPDDVSAIAWGLSLERPAMVYYGLDNIRDLFGPRVDLHFIQNCEMARLDKQRSNNNGGGGSSSATQQSGAAESG